jgi:hypothetical protein
MLLDTSGDTRMVNGQPFPLFIGNPNTLPIKLILEKTVFFDQIVDDSLLVAVKPTGQGDGQKLERMYDVCHCQNRLSVILLLTISYCSFEYLHHTGFCSGSSVENVECRRCGVTITRQA